jgi:hypothetical protein
MHGIREGQRSPAIRSLRADGIQTDPLARTRASRRSRRLAPRTTAECQHVVYSYNVRVIGRYIPKTSIWKIHSEFVHERLALIACASYRENRNRVVAAGTVGVASRWDSLWDTRDVGAPGSPDVRRRRRSGNVWRHDRSDNRITRRFSVLHQKPLAEGAIEG